MKDRPLLLVCVGVLSNTGQHVQNSFGTLKYKAMRESATQRVQPFGFRGL